MIFASVMLNVWVEGTVPWLLLFQLNDLLH